MYKVKCQLTNHYGSVISINEYCIGNKWKKLKQTIGNSKEPLTDEMLTEFIEKYKPVEVNLAIKDRKGEIHHVDFPIDSLTD